MSDDLRHALQCSVYINAWLKLAAAAKTRHSRLKNADQQGVGERLADVMAMMACDAYYDNTEDVPPCCHQAMTE